MTITEEEVEEAVRWLAVNADQIAKSRADAIYAEDMVKHIRAALVSELFGDYPISKATVMAEAHQEYMDALVSKRDAAFKDQLLRAKREGHSMMVSLFQTQSANSRVPNV